MASIVTGFDKPVHHFELKGRVPSKKNSLRRIKRGNHIFTVASQQHEDWHKEQLVMIRYQWTTRNLPLELVRYIEIVIYPPDRRGGDLSNKTESIMDLLVHAGVIKDDNWFVVPQLLLRAGEVDTKNPRALISIHL